MNSLSRKMTLNYSVDTLQNNKPDEVVQNLINTKKILHEARTSEEISSEFEINEDDFRKVLQIFKKKKTNSQTRTPQAFLYIYYYTVTVKNMGFQQESCSTLPLIYVVGCGDMKCDTPRYN